MVTQVFYRNSDKQHHHEGAKTYASLFTQTRWDLPKAIAEK
jgi:hypothetical protein